MAKQSVLTACENLLKALFGDDILDDPNFTETPKRMAIMYADFFTAQDLIEPMVEAFCTKSFPSEYKGIILLPNIHAVSFCPHHMLPVIYKITIAYIPSEESCMLGASKPERISRALAQYPILQEQLTADIVKAIQNTVKPLGLAVIVKGEHGCMRIRGIKNPHATMTTSEMIGAFKDNPETRQELFELLKQ